jgi:hypothetical protein
MLTVERMVLGISSARQQGENMTVRKRAVAGKVPLR